VGSNILRETTNPLDLKVPPGPFFTMKKGIDFTGVSVGYFCHDGSGNYLFAKRTDMCRDEHGKWDCGGGGVKFGEDVDAALKREIKEEFCTEPLNYEFLGYRNIHRVIDGKKSHWVAFAFRVLLARGKVKNGEPHKHEELGWFSLDNLPEPLHSHIPTTLKLFSEKL